MSNSNLSYFNSPALDMKIVMGDLNANVCSDNLGFEKAMGKHGCGSMNENGKRLMEFCSSNDLIVGGTIFPHKDIHKKTWYSPNGRDRNQIDHLMVNGTWRRSLQDVRVMRGADAASGHHLVMAIIKVNLRRTGKKKNMLQPRFNVERLREQKKERKFWITEETWQAIDRRKEVKKQVVTARSDRLKEKYKTKYQEANKGVQKKARANQRAFIDNLANQAEESAKKGEQGKVFQLTKLISGKYRGNASAPIEDIQGKLLTTEAEPDVRWAEHFNEILNRPPPTTQADIQEAEADLEINLEPPTRQEILAAIKSLKTGKAPGLDNLNAELFKEDPDLAAQLLLPLFSLIWEGKKVPDDWSEGIIVKIQFQRRDL
ncbi:uncharacterized protein LOC117108409 [Anneissia japonica]|uniref:uncharacterized protein LOC117108409 n=1 Tax=Anneissia japonica TaxID=1529436 RepID=UPI001425A528|nr:uncharacterized protein LOC117108409 [Anneissia japonica]